MLSLREAAAEVGLTKPALLKAIKSGRISAQRNDKGEWQIDPAELFRVYDRKGPAQTEPPTVSGNLSTEVSFGYQTVVDQLERRISGLERDKEDLRQERDRLLGVIEKQADQIKLLTDQRQPETARVEGGNGHAAAGGGQSVTETAEPETTGTRADSRLPEGILGRLRWLVTGRV